MIANDSMESMTSLPKNRKVLYVLLFLGIALLVIFTVNIKQNSCETPTYADDVELETCSEHDKKSEVIDSVFQYPSNASFLWKGDIWVSSENIYDVGYFVVHLLPYHPLEVQKEITYKIPISNLDYVSAPKVSHELNYGCVTVGASGYSGYYIFSLPEGEIIDQGRQYSSCVEWIDDQQVLIVERLYNASLSSYYILNVKTKSKKALSSFQ